MNMVKFSFLLLLGVIFSHTNGAYLNTKFLPAKTWWAKKVTDDVYVAGRLTASQYKFASEVGFKTILSNFNFTDDGFLGEEKMPSFVSTSKIAALAGFRFKKVLDDDTKWYSAQASTKFGLLYQNATKPVLYHCVTSYSSLFATLTYFARLYRADPKSKPRMTSMDIYTQAATMGFNFTEYPQIVPVISKITGESVPKSIPSTDAPRISSLWEVQPLYKDWFIGGQIQSNYLSKIKTNGIKTVINVRLGVTSLPHLKESQEEVDLLNIKENTGTYKDGGRQSKKRLEENRIDPSKSNMYINEQSAVNYASRNPLQFGDDIGYNETQERLAIQAHGLGYYHLPIDDQAGLTAAVFESYKATLQEASKYRPMLVHCDSGRRAAALVAVFVGWKNDLDSAWAIRRCSQLGYAFSEQDTPDVIKTFKQVLDKKRTGVATCREPYRILSIIAVIISLAT